MCTMVSQSQIWGARKEALSGFEGLMEVVGLELMAEGIMAGTHSKSRRERVPNFRSCNTETVAFVQIYVFISVICYTQNKK